MKRRQVVLGIILATLIVGALLVAGCSAADPITEAVYFKDVYSNGVLLTPNGNDPRLIVDALNSAEQFDVNASTTMVKVTNLDVPLTAGTYVFRYYVIYRSDTLATGIRYSVNYSGTNDAFVWNWYWIDLSALASTAVPDQDQLNADGSVMGAFSSRAKSALTRGVTLSVDTINADMFTIIEGVFVATGSGNLELYTASETTTGITSTMIGTSVIVTRTK